MPGLLDFLFSQNGGGLLGAFGGQQQGQMSPLDTEQWPPRPIGPQNAGGMLSMPQQQGQPSPLDNAQWPAGPMGAPSQGGALPPNAMPTQGQQPTAPQGVGFDPGSYLGAGLRGFGQSNNLVGGIFNLLTGNDPGAKTDAAIKGLGLPDNLTPILRDHPQLLQQIIAARLKPQEYGFQAVGENLVRTNPRSGEVQVLPVTTTKPTFGIIGEDQFGNKKYGWIDPAKRSTAPAEPDAPAGGAPAAPLTVTDANGKVLTIPAGQDPKKFREHVTTATADAMSGKLTEAQTNATQFANRMEDAERNVQKFQNSAGRLAPNMLRGVTDAKYSPLPRGPTNWLIPKEYEQFEQGKSQFITAMLRKESGAAINRDEFDRYDKEFFPQIGESKEVIAQKQHARSVAIEAMKKGAGPMYQTPDAGPRETITGASAPQDLKTFASPAAVQSAVTSGALKKGDYFMTHDGRLKTVP